MYSLKVLKELNHPDGRIFLPGHDCHSLSVLEIRALLENYSDHFEGLDEITREFIQNNFIRKEADEGLEDPDYDEQ